MPLSFAERLALEKERTKQVEARERRAGLLVQAAEARARKAEADLTRLRERLIAAEAHEARLEDKERRDAITRQEEQLSEQIRREEEDALAGLQG